MYKKIETLMEKRKVTPYQVAKETGIDVSTFSKWKDGTNKPSIDSLKKLAKYFKVSVEYFL